jgi:hypothetical protein
MFPVFCFNFFIMHIVDNPNFYNFQGRHNWGNVNESKGTKTCPICLQTSSVAPLVMGSEPGEIILKS